MTLRLAAVGLVLLTGVPRGGGRSHYVSPSGSSAGDGTMARPWDLTTGLAGGRGRVAPRDTIWLRGGTYRGAVVSSVRGAPGAPVVVRQYRGERAVIDGAGATSRTSRGDLFVVTGDYVVLWGFEVMDSDPDRTTDTRPNMLVNDASHTRYVNLIVHDGGIGFYTYARPVDVEVTGCLFYNNGWEGQRFGNGHGIYAKSDSGPLVLRDNVVFDQFGYGLHVYTEARSGLLNNIALEGNVAFNNGTISARPAAANILVGGRAPADAIVARDNMAYYSPGVGLVNVLFGWRNATVQNGALTLVHNYFVGGSVVLDIHAWRRATVSDNTLYGPAAHPVVQLDLTAGGIDSTNRLLRDPVQGPQVFVRPNRYERGRANVVIYNWTRQNTVAVGLANVLRPGERYEVRDVQDFFGSPVVRGVYSGGSVDIPVTRTMPPTPTGAAGAPAPPTAPEFAVFVVTAVAS